VRGLALAGLALSACVTVTAVDLHSIKQIELGLEPAHTVQGKNLAKVIAGATCHDDNKKWVHGTPAVIVLDSGVKLSITGIADTAHFIRMSDSQWCELDDKAWAALWK
jgi:hypothetical protein